MSDNDTTGPGGTLINFPRIGFNLNPTTTLPDPDPTTPDGDDSQPPRTPYRTGRRSPLDALNALPDPGLTRPLPVLPNTAPGPQPGHVPATFRNDPDHALTGTPGLGALSMAATLAVAIACLRGTHTVLSTWWENRQARHAETAQLREARAKHTLAMQQAGYTAQQAGAKHQAALAGIRDKGAQQRAKTTSKVPASSEFGRKALGSRTGAGSGGSGGSSGGRGGGAGRGNGGASGPKTKKNSSLFGPGSGGPGSKDRNPKKPSPLAPKSPHRGSQGGSKNLLNKHANKNPNKNGTGPGGANTPKKNPGPSGTGLGPALKKGIQKAAARRWQKRNKNGTATPDPRGNTPRPKADLKKRPGRDGNTTPGAAGKNGGRTTLADALRNDTVRAARKRLKQRRRTGTPPIWSAPKHQKQHKPASGGANTPKVNLNKPKNAAGARAARKQQRQHRNRQWWAKVRAYARKKTAARGPGAGGSGPAGSGTPGSGTGTGSGQRRSPFANAAAAAGSTYTVTSDHVPGSKAKRWEPSEITPSTPSLPSTGPAALDAAPTTTFPRPGTSRPKEPIPMPPAPGTSDPRLVKARNQAARTGRQVITQARRMDAQHETEITLDDAIDDFDRFKDDAFKTHDQCHKLAGRACKLRDILALFAHDLAVNHNLIGALFSGAMARLAESMDLLARMAEEMKASSLEAAEMAETAANDLNDAYRPYNTATADAGLSTPSAPIHNEA